MAEMLVDGAKLDACLDAEADAIRAKTGGSTDIAFDYANNKGFADAIAAIPTGGGGSVEVSPLVTTSQCKPCVESLLNAVIAEIGDKPFFARWVSGDVPNYCLYALYYIPQSVTQLTVADNNAGYYISTLRIEHKTFPNKEYFAWHRTDWEKNISNNYSYNISVNSVYKVIDLSELFGV